METDHSTAQTGNRSLRVVGIVATGKALNAKVRHEAVPAEVGGTFTIAFWAKVDAQEAQSREVDISVQMPDDDWPGFYNRTIVLDSTDWKEYTDTFVLEAEDVPAGVVEEVWVGLCVAESDVDFWIDDFRFFEGEPADEIREPENEPEDMVQEAVIRWGKLAATWGSIKRR